MGEANDGNRNLRSVVYQAHREKGANSMKQMRGLECAQSPRMNGVGEASADREIGHSVIERIFHSWMEVTFLSEGNEGSTDLRQLRIFNETGCTLETKRTTERSHRPFAQAFGHFLLASAEVARDHENSWFDLFCRQPPKPMLIVANGPWKLRSDRRRVSIPASIAPKKKSPR